MAGFETEIRSDLSSALAAEDINILVALWRCASLSKASEILGLTQGRLRHRFLRALTQLKSMARQDSRFARYDSIFTSMTIPLFK